MINKNKFSIKNTKKVLHKVGKQWVVVSAVLLGLVAGGAAVNETANADTTANASQQEVSQAPSSNASNVANPASKAALGATAAPASTARLGGVRGKVANAKTDIKSFYNNGLVTDAENEVNNYIKPSSNASTHAAAATAYNDLINNASANSIESYVNNGAALGSTTDTIANGTWLGEFNQALSDAHAIYSNNPTNPKVAYRLTQLDSLYSYNVGGFSSAVPVNEVLGYLGMSSPVSINYNYNISSSASNSLLNPVYKALNSVINPKMEKLDQPVNLSNIDLSQFSNEISNVNSELGLFNQFENKHIPQLPTKLPLPNNITYKDLLNINPYVNGDLSINGKLTVKVAPNTTVADILNSKTVPLLVSGGNISGSNIQAGLTTNHKGLINTEAVTQIQNNINNNLISPFKNKLKATIDGITKNKSLIASMDSKIDSQLTELDTLYSNINPITNLQQKVQDGINSVKLPQNLNGLVEDAIQQHNTITDTPESIPLPDISNDNAIYLANFLDNNDGNGKSGNMYQNALATEVNKRSDQSKVRKVAAGLRAIYEIMTNPTVQKGSTMKQDYDNILNDLKELPTVNENQAATDLATNSNKLADQFDTPNQSISGDKEYNHNIVNFLRNVAKNATNGKNNNVTPPNEVADVIDFIDSKDNKVVGSFTTGQGKPNTPFNVNLDKHLSKISKDYKLTNPEDATVTLNYDGATHDFNVTKVANPNNNHSHHTNPVNPQPNNPNNQNNSTNTNTNTTNNNVPYIAPDNFASSVAAQMNGNSASAQPSASASASSTNTSVAPEKHADNYAKVIKALQLHTNPNFTKKNAVAVVKPNTTFKIEKSVKAHNGALRYEVKYNKKNYFITANKHFVNAYYKATKHHNYSVKNYVHYRYAKVIKSLWLHTNAKFTKRNGVKRVKPNTEFHINNIVKNHGLVRYEVRHNHKNYFITANHHYTVNAYVQKYNFRKHGYKGVRVIKPLNEYRKLSFAKRSLIRHFYRGSVLPVKKVVTIASGEMTRLQLTNGHYVTANKDFVEPIR